MNEIIGFGHASYICPWCKKEFGYNACRPFGDNEASNLWHQHIKENHQKEYDKLRQKYERKKVMPDGKVISLLNIDMIFDLLLGRLPEDVKKKQIKEIKEQIKSKEIELKELKESLKDKQKE